MTQTAIIRRKLSAVLYGTGKALKESQIRKCSGKGFNHQAAEKVDDLLRAEFIWNFRYRTGHSSECRKWAGERQSVAGEEALGVQEISEFAEAMAASYRMLRTAMALCSVCRGKIIGNSLWGCWLEWALSKVFTPKRLKFAAHTRNFRKLLLSSNLLRKLGTMFNLNEKQFRNSITKQILKEILN